MKNSRNLKCEIVNSNNYKEFICIKKVPSLPEIVEISILTQFLDSRNPEELRPKGTTFTSHEQLLKFYKALGGYLREIY